MKPLTAKALLAGAVLAATVACGGVKDDPILRLSSSEALDIGKQLMEEEKFSQALRHLVHAFEVEPNSETGREGLLLAADALFLRGGYQSYVEAEQRYRDFLNRFPTSDRAAYAQFRLAAALAERIEKPDRDQQTARQALTEFENVRRLYPTSQYASQAAQRIVEVRNQLAEHEFVVGAFYYRFGAPNAAGNRFKDMLEAYPAYPEPDKILAYMCLSYVDVLKQIGSRRGLDRYDYLRDACDRLRSEHPESQWLKKVPSEERIRSLRTKVPEGPPLPPRRGDDDPAGEENDDG
ncbi:MAG: outer membrane protein assembly factor BamD [Acidobacteria bacterium]|nr:outer membrane protein assembly factor BamD [Acidobacteriota bacterium]